MWPKLTLTTVCEVVTGGTIYRVTGAALQRGSSSAATRGKRAEGKSVRAAAGLE
jgi:hypothetical protein